MQAHEALDRGDLDQARARLQAARAAGLADDDPAHLHVLALLAWFEGDVDEAGELFERTVATGRAEPRVFLDAAELATDLRDFDGAEDALRSLLEREAEGGVTLDIETSGEARLLLAQVRLSHADADPEEALELLNAIDNSLRDDPAWISVRAAALSELDRLDEALSQLRSAIEALGDDPSAADLLYQLGLLLRRGGDEAGAEAALLELRDRDLASLSVDPEAPLPDDERDDLQRRFEDVLDSLPDPILERVATAPITITRWVSREQISAGVDPRSPVAFEGRPTARTDEGEPLTDGPPPQLDNIALFRDLLIAEIDDDDEINDALVVALVDEIDRFFAIEDLVPGL